MISMSSRGDNNKTRNWISKILRGDIFAQLDQFGQMGVEALSRATPKNTGETAESWGYRIVGSRKHPGIEWFNTNEAYPGTSVAILIQYGHGTGTGGYVQGRDFINPAMQPLFDKIADEIWKRVTS